MKMAFPIQYELIIKESTLKKETKKERKSLGREKPKLSAFHVSLLAGIDHLKSQKWKVNQLCCKSLTLENFLGFTTIYCHWHHHLYQTSQAPVEGRHPLLLLLPPLRQVGEIVKIPTTHSLSKNRHYRSLLIWNRILIITIRVWSRANFWKLLGTG